MSDAGNCEIWSRFESKARNGNTFKMRIQSWSLKPEDRVYEFMMEHFVPGEAIHEAAGIVKSQEALLEYRELMTIFVNEATHHATVCCFDDDSNNVEQILGVSVVQLMKKTDSLGDITKHMEFKTPEMKRLLYTAKVLEDDLKDKLTLCSSESFHFGRGIIVHPDYRGLGIANELIKVRESISKEDNVHMTCAGMSAPGTQYAAHKNRWNTFSDIPRREMEKKTGLVFKEDMKSHKLMYLSL